MGKAKRQLKKQQRIHGKRKLFGGLKTAEQIHAELSFPTNARCQSCNSRGPTIRAITMCPMADAMQRWPELEKVDAPELFKRVVQIKENAADQMGSPYLRVGMVYSCKTCAPALEKTLAKLPSWMIVEINRGPGEDKILVGAS